MMTHELDAKRRAPGLQTAHGFDQEGVVSVPVVSGPYDKIWLGLTYALPEVGVDSEVE